jgi:AAA domain/RepB DNA-primase from phage plasmid
LQPELKTTATEIDMKTYKIDFSNTAIEPTLEDRVAMACDYLYWLAVRQPLGQFALRAFENQIGQAELRLVTTKYFDNRNKRFRQEIKHFVRRALKQDWHLFYGVNSFSGREAKAKNVTASRLAQVDADGVDLPPPGPPPTRVIETSPGNYQFIYELDRELPRLEVEAISARLTKLVGGDRGGHSSAKLFRLPGSFNIKPAYHPSPLVRIIDAGGPIHDPTTMFASECSETDVFSSPTNSLNLDTTSCDPKTILKKYKSRIPQDIQMRLRQRQPYKSFALRLAGKSIVIPKDDRSEIIWQIGTAFRDAGATPAEALSIIEASAFWRDRQNEGKAERSERLIRKIFEENPSAKLVGRVATIDPADWVGKPVPPREWLIEEWVPMKKVTGFYGDGGTGKTTLALQLAIDVALGNPFQDVPTKQGKVFAFLAEDEEEDSHIAIAALCRRCSRDLSELRGLMQIAPRAASDNIFINFVNGKPTLTPLFDQLLVQLQKFEPTLVIIDTAADVFGGNENIRPEVRAFVAGCCGRIARETGAAVLLLAHPSQAGLSNNRGDGGSTAWSNTMRGRLYLRYDPDGDEDDRILELKKINAGRGGKSLRLRWSDGGFGIGGAVGKSGVTFPEDSQVIEEISRAYSAGDALSAHAQAGFRWIGVWIMKNLKKRKNQARAIIARLMTSGVIREIEYDPHRHRSGLCTTAQAEQFQRAKEMRQSETMAGK